MKILLYALLLAAGLFIGDSSTTPQNQPTPEPENQMKAAEGDGALFSVVWHAEGTRKNGKVCECSACLGVCVIQNPINGTYGILAPSTKDFGTVRLYSLGHLASRRSDFFVDAPISVELAKFRKTPYAKITVLPGTYTYHPKPGPTMVDGQPMLTTGYVDVRIANK